MQQIKHLFIRSHIWVVILSLFCLLGLGIRFYGLDGTPKGFYVDEAMGAVQVLCLSEDGTVFNGENLPLYAQDSFHSFHSPTYIYPLTVWTAFGKYNSPWAFRSFSAFITCLSLLVLFLLASRLGDRRVGFYAVLVGSLSPWSFQYSRIAWDPPLMPLFVLLGLYCYLRIDWQMLGSGTACDKSKKTDNAHSTPHGGIDLVSSHWAILSGLSFSLAAYSYAPARLLVPCFVAFLFYFCRSWMRWRVFALFCASVIIASLPLLNYLLRDEFLDRSKYLSVYYYNHGDIFAALQHFIRNFSLHFHPLFLFVTGDANLRSSTGHTGVLSFLDIMAIVVLFVSTLLGGKLSFRKRILLKDRNRIWLLSCAGICIAVLPSALTWEGQPHALRSIGCWPFWAMLSGFVLKTSIELWPYLQRIFVLTCFAWSLYYFSVYFVVYPEASAEWFSYSMNEGIRSRLANVDVSELNYPPSPQSKQSWRGFFSQFPDIRTSPENLAYFLMVDRGLSCGEARELIREITKR